MGLLRPRRGARILAACLMAGISLAGEDGDGSSLAAVHSAQDIESAMLFNFTKFVEWPQGALGDTGGSPAVVGVIGDDLIAPVLASALRNKTIYGHAIVVLRLKSSADLKGCAVLLVGSADKKEIDRIVGSVGKAPVLTIGEHAQFSRLGGIIAFVRDGNRLCFEINVDAAERAGLQMSSKMLRLAAIWRETPPQARN